MLLERPLASLPLDRAICALDRLAPALALSPDDPHLFALGLQQVAARWQDAGGPAAFEPIGLFGYRALGARTGLAYAVAREASTIHAVDLTKTLILSIAHKARIAGHDRWCVITADRAMRGALGQFGVEFPAEQQLRGHLVGWFDLTANLARVA